MSELIINRHSQGVYKLTTVEILYFMPDYKDILQLFVWQEFDFYPSFPNLTKFVNFWNKEIEGKIHSLRIVSSDNVIIRPIQHKYELN